MFKVNKNSDKTAAYVVEIIADYLSDIEDLPTIYEVGSSCLVIENSSLWMLGNDKQWHELE